MGAGFVRVFATHPWLQGEIVKGRLEAEGVPVELTGEHEGPYPVGPAELLVPARLETRARRIIAEIESGSFIVERPDAAAAESTPEERA